MIREARQRGRLKGAAAALGCALVLASAAFAWRREGRPRAWAARDVPVTFWAWRDGLPAEAEVERAAREARAQALFVRAGQLHAEGQRIVRVRRPEGRFPRALPVHLVYNATRALLASFEAIDAAALASATEEAFKEDSRRATADGARVIGLQLDLDVPTRLLPRYAGLLTILRARLPRDARLSVTGLPTWMESRALADVLAAVDFWTPQFYGARIPERLAERLPVSSPASVAAGVERARKLGRPFYAGLAAYGYAALYTARGELVEIRGDIDPALVARDPNFDLVGRAPFDPAPGASRWRYVFRARADASVAGLEARAGESIVLDVPGAAALRADARAVRERAGESLLGVCLFRLPAPDDPTVLTLPQVAAALADAEADDATVVRLEASGAGGCGDAAAVPERLTLVVENAGARDALLGGALTVTVGFPAGSVRGVLSLENFTNVETLCGAGTRGVMSAAPCGTRRADAVRLSAPAWRPGATARVSLSVAGPLPDELDVSVRVLADDGRVREHPRRARVERGAAKDEKSF